MGSISGLENGVHGSKTGVQYAVPAKRLGEARHLRIITVGAGASGINLARHLELHMQNFENVIYEKNVDVGGTWLENTYLALMTSCST